MVGGVTPGKGGQTHLGLPVFNSVAEAMQETEANASVTACRRPSPRIDPEAIDAGMPLIICITEGIPVLDMVRVKRADGSDCRLIGPNCPGISPLANARSIMPGHPHPRQDRYRVALRQADL